MNASPLTMRLIAVFAPILAVVGYLQFRGGFSTPVLVAVLALHGLLALAAAAVLAKKQWARPILLATLAFLFVWYTFALAMSLMGLAAGGLSDPSQRPTILALFATIFVGLGAAGWLLLGIRSSRSQSSDDRNGVL